MRDSRTNVVNNSGVVAQEIALDRLARRLPRMSFAEAVTMLPTLVSEPDFWHTQVAPLLAVAHSVASGCTECRIGRSFGNQTAGAILQLFVWPPGSTTSVHDHSCWGVLHCISGAIWEERYDRLDDGARLDVAHLRQAWARSWQCWDGVTTLLPYDAGIHRIANPGTEITVSAHLYGPRLGLADGRDYDPTCNYVCDRFEP